MSKSELFRRCDFHMHSVLSPCARRDMELRAIIEVCGERGIKYLGITDHITADTDSGILWQTRRELSDLHPSMKVYLGCEADVLDVGKHTVTDEMRAELDFIAVAANHFSNPFVVRPDSHDRRAIAQHYLRMFEYACSLDFADVVVHPLYVMPGTHDPALLNLLEDPEMIEVISLAKKNCVAIEISPRSLVPEQMRFRMRFLGLCKKAGVKFSIGSDAHQIEMAGMTSLVAPIIEELGIVDDDIWLPESER